MAGVKTEISLQDKMSSVLRDIQKALDASTEAMDSLGESADETGDDLDDLGSSEKKAGKEAEESSDKHSKLAGVLKGVGAAAAAAAAAAGVAAFKLGQEVVSSYADYEQLVGGVETLFKDSAPVVQEYANQAYKTAGLSANAYMETVTGFSASLLQSLGGDTEKAAKYADMAVIDMADNANKMGSDMASIQNAYQGFAKQNYTMLDNLKLGYGGTKEEMQRLLSDAEKLSGQKFDISSYADIVDAIHIVQTEMGITGTTAKEAEATISGSLNMLKGSYENLLTGLGNPDADVEQLADNVINSVITVANNIMPVLQDIVSALPNVALTLAEALEEMGPELLDTVISLFDSVLDMLLTLLPRLIPIVVNLILKLTKSIISAAPKLISAGQKIIIELINGISSALPELLPLAAEAIVYIVTGLTENLDSLADCAILLLESLGDALLTAIPILAEAAPKIIENIGLFLAQNGPMLITTGIELLIKLIEGLPQAISIICKQLPTIVSSITSALLEPNNLSMIIKAGVDLLIALIENSAEIIEIVIGIVPMICGALVDEFEKKWEDLKQAGKDLIQGLWNGLKEKWEEAKEWLGGVGSAIVDGFKSVFRIGSPSKVFEEIGIFVGEGFTIGLKESTGSVISAAESMANGALDAAGDISTTAKIGTEYYATYGNAASMVGTQAITGSEYTTTGETYVPASGPVVNVTIDMSGMNTTISSDTDIDGLLDTLTQRVGEAVRTAAAGVH